MAEIGIDPNYCGGPSPFCVHQGRVRAFPLSDGSTKIVAEPKFGGWETAVYFILSAAEVRALTDSLPVVVGGRLLTGNATGMFARGILRNAKRPGSRLKIIDDYEEEPP